MWLPYQVSIIHVLLSSWCIRGCLECVPTVFGMMMMVKSLFINGSISIETSDRSGATQICMDKSVINSGEIAYYINQRNRLQGFSDHWCFSGEVPPRSWWLILDGRWSDFGLVYQNNWNTQWVLQGRIHRLPISHKTTILIALFAFRGSEGLFWSWLGSYDIQFYKFFNYRLCWNLLWKSGIRA